MVKRWSKASEAERQEMSKMYGGLARLRVHFPVFPFVQYPFQQFVESIQNENWIESNSKPCPHCQAAIEVSFGEGPTSGRVCEMRLEKLHIVLKMA